MSFTVTMPQLGETVTEGTILRWVKQPGDTVAEDDVLLEISTDKVDTEVPSPFSGTMLEILVQEGETVDVGTALAVIGEPGEATAPAAPAAEQPSTSSAAPTAPEPAPAPAPAAPAAPAPAAPPPAPAATPASPPPPPPPPSPPPATPQETAAPATPTAAPAAGGVTAGVLSPVVRRLAAEHGIDVSAVTGTGRGGRITRRDIEGFIATAGTSVPPSTAPAADERKAGLGRGISELMADSTAPPSGVVTGAAAAAQASPAPAEAAAPAQPVGAGSTEQPIDRLRTRIATNMIKAKQTAAHVWTSMEVDFEAVERVRRAHRPAFKEREGFSLTYLPFIARATMDTLAEYPVVNSSFDLEGGTRTFHGAVNLGIGVDLNQEGLVVMTIRGADGLRMRGVAREVRRLADKARSGAMEPDDLAGSTFTITNPGPYGSFMSAPIINVPNVAILSTDGIKKRPVVITDAAGNDAIAIHHVGYLGLTWDHRAFDGSTAVLFLRHIKENLETWDWEQELA